MKGVLLQGIRCLSMLSLLPQVVNDACTQWAISPKIGADSVAVNQPLLVLLVRLPGMQQRYSQGYFSACP